MDVVVSACLLGEPCRFDGGSRPCAAVRELASHVRVHPVCPEVEGGLPIPRPPAEIVGEHVLTRDGTDVTEAYVAGARACLETARATGASLAVLKARSPSCGVGTIYDGTHTGKLVQGNGVFAQMLIDEGIRVVTEDMAGTVHAMLDVSTPHGRTSDGTKPQSG